MKTLAFITFVLLGPDGSEVTLVTNQPVVCEITTAHFTMVFEAAGYEVDWICHETGAPITSIRPQVRP